MPRLADALTVADLLLVAAAAVEKDHAPWTKWDLAVAAWRLAPDRFAMKGHPYPSDNRVIMELCSKKPSSPLALGYVVRLGQSKYQLTPAGRARAGELLDAAELHAVRAQVLPLVQDATFRRWLDTMATPEAPPAFDAHAGFGWALRAIGWTKEHTTDRLPGDPVVYAAELSELLAFCQMVRGDGA